MKRWILSVAALSTLLGAHDRPYELQDVFSNNYDPEAFRKSSIKIVGEVFAVHCFQGGCDIKIKSNGFLVNLHYDDPREVVDLKRGIPFEGMCRFISSFEYDHCRSNHEQPKTKSPQPKVRIEIYE